MPKDDIYKRLKNSIAMDKFNKHEKIRIKRRDFINSFMSILVCLFSISGIVFANEISTKIYENYFQTGNGVGAAIENGYIEKNNDDHLADMEKAYAKNEYTGETIDGTLTKIKVDKLLMDDFNLSITLDVELSDELDPIINSKNIRDMSMPDIVIYDENNNILFHEYNYSIKQFCDYKKFDLNEYDILNNTEKVVNSGFSSYIIEKDENHIKFLFNIYTGDDSFPKSKELNFYLTEIRLSENAETRNGEEEVSLSGSWNFSAEVPEKMYDRTKIKYNMLSTSDNSFKLNSAYLYDTGMNIDFSFWTGEENKRERITIPEIEFWESLDDENELKDIEILNYYTSVKLENSEEYREQSNNSYKRYIFEKYLVNEKGEKFELSVGARENGGSSISEDGTMHFKGMFDLTKYDATDKVTLYIDYHDKKIEVKLMKVGEE